MRLSAFVSVAFASTFIALGCGGSDGATPAAPKPKAQLRTSASRQTGFTCSGSFGSVKAADDLYYATDFGCYVKPDGSNGGDPGDNCIPSCLSKTSECAGLSGPDCERKLQWYSADAARFGCNAHIKVTNPKNNKQVILAAIDNGPACSLENKVSHTLLDMSTPAILYLFGEEHGYQDKAIVEVEPGDGYVKLGPTDGTEAAGGGTGSSDDSSTTTNPSDDSSSGDDSGTTTNPSGGAGTTGSTGNPSNPSDDSSASDDASAGDDGAAGDDAGSNCGDVTDLGVCNGNELDYCNDGLLIKRDCTSDSLTCGFATGTGWYDCLDASGLAPSTDPGLNDGDDGGGDDNSGDDASASGDDSSSTGNCGAVTWVGTCNDGTLQYCDNGVLKTQTCGSGCGFDQASGFNACYADN